MVWQNFEAGHMKVFFHGLSKLLPCLNFYFSFCCSLWKKRRSLDTDLSTESGESSMSITQNSSFKLLASLTTDVHKSVLEWPPWQVPTAFLPGLLVLASVLKDLDMVHSIQPQCPPPHSVHRRKIIKFISHWSFNAMFLNNPSTKSLPNGDQVTALLLSLLKSIIGLWPLCSGTKYTLYE